VLYYKNNGITSLKVEHGSIAKKFNENVNINMKIPIDKHLAKKILAIITCAIPNCFGYVDPSKRVMCNKNNSYKI
jgi:hypothetical protein